MVVYNNYILCKPYEKEVSGNLYSNKMLDYMRGEVYKTIVIESSSVDFKKGDIIYIPERGCLKYEENKGELYFLVKKENILMKEEGEI